MYLDSLAHWYDLSTPVGNPDLGVVGGMPATGANIASNPPGIGGGRCAEFNGNNSNYNLGDVAELNEVSAFTIAFWMNQDVIDQTDWIWWRSLDGTHGIFFYIHVGGQLYFYIRNGADTYGEFDYSAAINAGQWHYVAAVFDGSHADNAGRMIVYVDANPVTLTFNGTIPATTPNLSAAPSFLIGHTTTAFDGKLDEFMILTDPLTRIQVTDLMLRTRRGLLKP